VFSCTDANGSSCTKIKDCERDIEDQKVTDSNKSYKSCPFPESFAKKSRYFKLSMNAWGKRGSTWYEGNGADWQYTIRDVQFQVNPEGKLACGEHCTIIGLGNTRYLKADGNGNHVVTAATDCATGYYETKQPTLTADRVCSVWPTPAAHQKVKVAGTSTSAPIFENKCSNEHWYDNGTCRALTVCSKSEYEKTAPSPARNRVCGSNADKCECDELTGKISGSCAQKNVMYEVWEKEDYAWRRATPKRACELIGQWHIKNKYSPGISSNQFTGCDINTPPESRWVSGRVCNDFALKFILDHAGVVRKNSEHNAFIANWGDRDKDNWKKVSANKGIYLFPHPSGGWVRKH
jgi:hypothetical protein